jgi:hypothetical protein
LGNLETEYLMRGEYAPARLYRENAGRGAKGLTNSGPGHDRRHGKSRTKAHAVELILQSPLMLTAPRIGRSPRTAG